MTIRDMCDYLKLLEYSTRNSRAKDNERGSQQIKEDMSLLNIYLDDISLRLNNLEEVNNIFGRYGKIYEIR